MTSQLVCHVLTFVGSSAVLGGILAWLIRSLLTHWINKDLEAHKSRLKTESDSQLATLRSSLTQQALEHEVQYRRLDAEVAERLNEIYVRLLSLYQEVASYVKDIELGHEPSKEEKFESVRDANSQFWDYFLANRLYVPPKLFSRTRDFADEMRRITLEFNRNLSSPNQAYKSDPDFWERAMDDVHTHAAPVFSALVADFQKRLGVFDNDDETPPLTVRPATTTIAPTPPSDCREEGSND